MSLLWRVGLNMSTSVYAPEKSVKQCFLRIRIAVVMAGYHTGMLSMTTRRSKVPARWERSTDYHFLRSSITRSCDWRMADFIMAERIFRLSFCYSLSRFLWNQSLSLACRLSRSRISVSRRISSWVGAGEGVDTGVIAVTAV